MADDIMRSSGARKVVTNKERERRLKAARRRKTFKRAVVILVGVLIIAGLVSLTVVFVKALRKLWSRSRVTEKYICSVYQVEQAGDSLLLSAGDVNFTVRDGVLTCAESSGARIWSEDLGEGDYTMIACKKGVVVYAPGGSAVKCFDEQGLTWQRTGTGPLGFVVLNRDATHCLICTEAGDSSVRRIEYFSTKNADKNLLTKEYKENRVMSAAISPNGKIISVTELKISESDEAASSRISVIDVESGRTFKSEIMKNEICPFSEFTNDTELVAAGRKNVYLFEKLSRSDAKSAAVSRLLTLGDNGNDVLCILAAKSKVVVAVGNGDGKSEVKIFDTGAGTERAFTVPKNVKYLMNCLPEVFICCTQDEFMMYDFDGNKVGAGDETLDIERITSDGNGSFAITGVYGTTIVKVEKVG